MDGELGSSLPRGHLRTVARPVHGAVDTHATDLSAAIAARHVVRSAQVVCGNGGTELIRLVAPLALGPGDTAPAPVFRECEMATALAGARLERVQLLHASVLAGFRCDEPALHDAPATVRPRLRWLCAPSNPIGAALPVALIAQGCLVRDYSSFGPPEYVRVSPRHPAQNDRLPAAFGSLQPPEGGA